jgi:PAS domain S-box-containing protein
MGRIEKMKIFSTILESKTFRFGYRGMLLSGLFISLVAYGDEQMPMAAEVLTNIQQIWTVPHDRANERYRIKTEVTVYFDDSEWGNASGECNGVPYWLPIFDSPAPFKAGERIAIDGVIVPERERFIWSETKTRVLQENAPLTAVTVTHLDENPNAVKDHLVSVEGLIDSEIDQATHCTIVLLQGGVSAYAYILKSTNSPPVPFKPGDIIRMTGVYNAQFDKGGKLSSLSLWAGSPADVKIIGSLDKDARFNAPVTPARELQFLSQDNLVHVEGVVHKYEAGQWVTIWDKTGQITIQSKQNQTLSFGDVIEAVGHPYYVGVQACLHDALYRVANATNAAAFLQDMATNAVPLCLAEQVRDLSLEDAARHLPVTIQGIVTWGHSDTSFAYVQDGSGGVRVVNPKWDDPGSMKPGTVVRLNGVTAAGSFVPVVTNAVLHRTGWFNIDPGQFVTLEQALTGIEEGNWVEMQGFVRNISQTKGLVRFDLSTSSGEFQVWGPAAQSYDWYKGSIVRVDGVCSAVANKRHQLKGVQIWTPDINTYAHVEVPAPYDVFAAPFRPLANLRRFDVESALNQRVRTSGTVVRAEPGRGISLQDGVDSVLALSQQKDPLQPGDKVEVVGFPGQQNQRFVLREAVYRRIANGPEPAPLPLSPTNSTDANLDGLLVQARGTLLNMMKKNGETRLLAQAKGFTFEANLDSSIAEGDTLQDLQLASQIAVKGVYEMQRDEYGRPRSFLLRLRSGNDIQLVQQAPWWTPSRLLAGLVGTVIVFLVALIWGLLIARKNKLLGQVQADLQTAKDKLEARVEERTEELTRKIREHRESQALYLSLVEQLPAGVFRKDAEGRYVFVNSWFCNLRGKNPDEILGKTAKELASVESGQNEIQLLRLGTGHHEEIIREGKTIQAEEEYPAAGGGKRHLQVIKTPVFDADKNIAGSQGILVDITERKKAEAELTREMREHRESQALYLSLVEQLPAGVFRKDSEGRYVLVNKWFCNLCGITPQEILGKKSTEVAASKVKETEIIALKTGASHHDEIMRTGKNIEAMEEHHDTNGRLRHVQAIKTPVFGAEGELAGSQGILIDVTDRKAAEAALAYEKYLLNALLNNSDDKIYFKDAGSKFIRCSASMAKLFNVERPEDLIGKSDHDFFSEEHAREALENEQEIIRTGKPMLGKVEKETWPDGRVTWAITTKMPLCDEAGKIVGTFGVSKDITEIKKTEAELEQAHRQLVDASRQAGMAEVATSVLHNVGNVLNSVNVSALFIADKFRKSKIANIVKLGELLREHEKDLGNFVANDPRGQKLPEYIAKLAEHLTLEQENILGEIGSLVNNIVHIKEIVAMQQGYAKPSGIMEPLKAADLVEDALSINIGAVDRHNIKVVRDFNKTPAIVTDKHKVLQILVNLIRNSKYACDDTGRNDKEIILRVHNGEGRVKISVIDNGIGIAPENLTRIFNHGFTTRKDGHGFGLHSGALAAKELGGTLTAFSEGPGKGAVFTLELPAGQEQKDHEH